jgi:hypothetical protein
MKWAIQRGGRSIGGGFSVVVLALSISGCGAAPGASTGALDSPAIAPDATPTQAEATLFEGIRLDLQDGACRPLRTGLPEHAIAGVECRPEDVAIEVARAYLFNRDEETITAYLGRIEAEGIEPGVDRPQDSISESSYWPEPAGLMNDGRHAHWLDDAGHGHYLATSMPFVLLDVTGTDANVDVLYSWAWRGNQDVPGAPTLWRESGPTDPNGKG